MATLAPPVPSTRIACPAPGIYPGVPAEVYHAWDAASNSALTKLDRSPAHCRAALDEPRLPTPALIRGDAVHTAVLEPHLFARRYTVAEQCGETVKSGVNAGARCTNDGKVFRGGIWRCGQHDKRESEETRRVLSLADFAVCMGMRQAVHAHPVAAALLDNADDRELSIVFHWPGTEILCKARIDIPAFAARSIGDLKSMGDASPEQFPRSVQTYGYHRQAVFYQTACAAHGQEVDDFHLIAVEPEAPYGTVVARVDEAAQSVGRRELARLLAIWQECVSTGCWPCYPTHVVDVSLPPWAFKAEGW
jgi:hypothetical protein